MAYLQYHPMNSLFHYTSVEAFSNIMRSGEFWFSDLKESNDPREFDMPKRRVMDAIRRFDRLQIPPEIRHQTMFLTLPLIHVLSTQNVYSFSLTPNRDSLSEWKEYGANGSGVAFSIRPRAIRDMYVRVQKVEYVSDNDEQTFDNLVETQFEKLRYASEEGLSVEDKVALVTWDLGPFFSNSP